MLLRRPGQLVIWFNISVTFIGWKIRPILDKRRFNNELKTATKFGQDILDHGVIVGNEIDNMDVPGSMDGYNPPNLHQTRPDEMLKRRKESCISEKMLIQSVFTNGKLNTS